MYLIIGRGFWIVLKYGIGYLIVFFLRWKFYCWFDGVYIVVKFDLIVIVFCSFC